MENKKTLYVALALVGGIIVGYMTGGANISVQDQGATARISSASDAVSVEQLSSGKTEVKRVKQGCSIFSRKHIRITSPNGGEVYSAGQLVSVTWNSCGYSSNTIMIDLYSSVLNQSVELAITANDGQETVYIPTIFAVQGMPPVTPGNFYKIGVSPGGNPSLRDYSDNFFTINTGPFLPGCTSSAGFSAVNGYPCNTAGSLDFACLNGLNYSSTTGMACNPTQNISLYTSPISIATTSTVNSGNLNDIGVFTIKYNLTAWNGDIYIPKTISTGGNSNIYTVDMNGAPESGGLYAAMTCNTCTNTLGNRYLINDGQTAEIEMTITVDNSNTVNGAGNYRAALSLIRWTTDDISPFAAVYIPTNLSSYATPYQYLD